MPTVEKPCIRKCSLNEEDICLGCFRTFDDMLAWNKSTHSQRVEMLKKAQERKSTSNPHNHYIIRGSLKL